MKFWAITPSWRRRTLSSLASTAVNIKSLNLKFKRGMRLNRQSYQKLKYMRSHHSKRRRRPSQVNSETAIDKNNIKARMAGIRDTWWLSRTARITLFTLSLTREIGRLTTRSYLSYTSRSSRTSPSYNCPTLILKEIFMQRNAGNRGLTVELASKTKSNTHLGASTSLTTPDPCLSLTFNIGNSSTTRASILLVTKLSGNTGLSKLSKT